MNYWIAFFLILISGLSFAFFKAIFSLQDKIEKLERNKASTDDIETVHSNVVNLYKTVKTLGSIDLKNKKREEIKNKSSNNKKEDIDGIQSDISEIKKQLERFKKDKK